MARPSSAATSDPVPRPRRGTSPVTKIATAAVTVVLALEALDDLIYLWRRMGRFVNGWWDDVEHHERVRLHRAELGYLARRFPAR